MTKLKHTFCFCITLNQQKSGTKYTSGKGFYKTIYYFALYFNTIRGNACLSDPSNKFLKLFPQPNSL